MKEIDSLFLVFDPGDALALAPVFERFERDSLSFGVLALGPSHTLLGDKDYVFTHRIGDLATLRTSSVPLGELDILTQKIKAKIVVTCPVSTLQLQLAQAFKKQGSKLALYFETLTLDPLDALNRDFLDLKPNVMVTTHRIARQFKNLVPDLDVSAVGQPRFDEWAKIKSEVKLTTKKTILYSGTYCEDHEALFRLFAESAKYLKEFDLICSLHPKSDGSIERKIISDLNIQNIEILSKKISTLDAAIMADLIVCHRSTIGFQSLFMGKRVIYLDTPGSTYTDTPIIEKWAQVTSSSPAFVELVKKELMTDEIVRKNIYALAELPANGIENILGNLKCLLQT